MRFLFACFVFLFLSIQTKADNPPFGFSGESFSIENQRFFEGIPAAEQTVKSAFERIYNNLSGINGRHLCDALNALWQSNVKDAAPYTRFAECVDGFTDKIKGGDASLGQFLVTVKELVLKGKPGSAENFLSVSVIFFKNLVLSPAGASIVWRVSGGEIFFTGGMTPSYRIQGCTLTATEGDQRMELRQLNGSFYPLVDLLRVSGAFSDWQRVGPVAELLSVKLADFTIHTSKGYYTCPNAILATSIAKGQRISGTFSDNVQVKNTGKVVYPRFESGVDVILGDPGKGMQYVGGLSIRGPNFYGKGVDTEKGRMTFYHQGKPVMVFESENFIFRDSLIVSPESAMDISCKGGTMNHRFIMFVYSPGQGTVRGALNANKMSKAPFSDGISGNEFYAESFLWNLDSTHVYFLGNRFSPVAAVSDRYYDHDLYAQFQGVSTRNPLDALTGLYERYADTYIPFETVRSTLNTDESSCSYILSELTAQGYAHFDIQKRQVIFYPWLRHITLSAARRVDYDAIAFVGQKDAAVASRLDITTGKLTMTRISRIDIDTKGLVSVVPDSSGVRMTTGKDFTFNGQTSVGLYRFSGAESFFDYKGYLMDMNGRQRMSFSVPSFEKSPDGNYVAVDVLNPIDSLRGKLYIDVPNNKSGRLRNAQYPKLEVLDDAYVFFTGDEIGRKYYDRKNIYFKVYPFILDSLTSRNGRRVVFNGHLSMPGVFDDITWALTVQRDYSLGFASLEKREGLPFYEKGIFRGELTLNSKGLTSEGEFEYLNVKGVSDDMLILPDSLKANATRLTLTASPAGELNNPPLEGDSVRVVWLPKRDTLVAQTTSRMLSLYDGYMQMQGKIIHTPQGITGAGRLLFETADAKSDSLFLGYDKLNSPSMDIRFGTKEDPRKIALDSVASQIDVAARQGYFTLREGNNYVTLDVNRYHAFLPHVRWDIDNSLLYLASNEGVQSLMQSFHPGQDSLGFFAREAVYSILTDSLTAYGVDSVMVADAMIVPDSSVVGIQSNGFIAPLENAVIHIDKISKTHKIADAKVNISSAHNYKASGTYLYLDNFGMEQPLLFDDIRVEEATGTSLARSNAYQSEVFPLSPYFNFRGQIQLRGDVKDLVFDGRVELPYEYCANMQAGTLRVHAPVNSQTVRFSALGQVGGKELIEPFSGIYYNTLGFNVAFMMEDNLARRGSFAHADGDVYYDEDRMAYVVSDSLEGGDEFLFFNDECRVRVTGRINFYDPSGTVALNAFGTVERNLNDNTLHIEAMTLALGFFFDPGVISAIFDEVFSSPASLNRAVDDKAVDYAIRRASTNKESNLLETKTNTVFIGIPRVEWDDDARTLTSKDEHIDVVMLDGKSVNKVLHGKLEIIKNNKGGDDFKILISTEDDYYYYFRYKNAVVDFFTNKKEVMAAFDAVPDKSKAKKYGDVAYQYRKSSRSRAEAFRTLKGD